MINLRRSVVAIAIAILAVVLTSPTLALDLGRRPLLGITATNLSQADRDANHLAADQGVSVQRITPGSGADQAGIQTGDILLSIDAEQIGSVDALTTG
jgi:S1-C subfamily serine protease